MSQLVELYLTLPEYDRWKCSVLENYSGPFNGNIGVYHKYDISLALGHDLIRSYERGLISKSDAINEIKENSSLWNVDNGIVLSEEEYELISKKDIIMKNIVVTGAQGQTGSYMCDLLLEKGYNVIGVARRKSAGAGHNSNLAQCINNPNFLLEYGDISDTSFVNWIIQKYKPEVYYNFAAMSHVGQSFKEPLSTFVVDGTAVVIALDAIRRLSPETKFYQASTSELFGTTECPENGYTEDSQFHPRSPYGVAKMAAYWAAVNAREAYGVYACNGILHNHESPRRGLDFAPRKITNGVAAIKLGLQDCLKMGNLDAYRDIGHAKDYVKAIYLMMSQDAPDDYVVATGESVSIKEMLEYVCSIAGLDFKDVYMMDERFMRPSEVPFLKGNSSKIRSLGWVPEYNWKDLLKEMFDRDLDILIDLAKTGK